MTENREMNDRAAGSPASTACCRFHWRLFVLLTLGIVAALVGRWACRIATDTPAEAPDVGGNTDAIVVERVDAEAVRQEAWQRIEPRLREADERTRDLTSRLIGRIESFFDARKAGAREFAEAALGWRSKWELIKSRQGHREFIAERFSEYIFTQEELAALLAEAAAEYAQGLKAVENELLVQIRADLQDLPASALPSFSNEQVLSGRFGQVVAAVAADVARDFQVNVGQEIGSFAIGEVAAAVVTKTLTAAATRLGISGTVLGTGAAASWATFGAGIVIAIAVDLVLDWIIDWFHDPVGNISDKVVASLDDVKQSITMGDPEARRVHDRVAQMAQSHADPAVQARAAQVLARMQRGGALGLKYALGKVADAHGRTRQLALRQLVFGEEKP